MSKRILVTGASGFVGRHLCASLVKDGHIVTAHYFHHKPLFEDRRIKFAKADLTQLSQASRMFRGFKPDVIFHLAALSIPSLSWKNPEKAFSSNALSTINLLEAIRSQKLKSKFILASTTHVYGRSFSAKKPLGEETLAWPESPYAWSKLSAEFACLNYYNLFGVKTVIARSANAFGTGQSSELVFPDWCRQIALIETRKNKPVLEVGNIRIYRDFLHVQDVISAYRLLMRKGRPGCIYNIASGRPVQIKKYLNFMTGLSKIKIKVIEKKSRMRRFDHLYTRINPARLKRLGWKQSHTVFDAIEDILDEQRRKV